MFVFGVFCASLQIFLPGETLMESTRTSDKDLDMLGDTLVVVTDMVSCVMDFVVLTVQPFKT